MKLSEIRSLYKEVYNAENTSYQKEEVTKGSSAEYVDIGAFVEVTTFTSPVTDSYKLIALKDESLSSMCIKFSDGEIAIALQIHEPSYERHVQAILAHEIGHIQRGHLSDNSSRDDYVDRNVRKQIFYLNQYRQTNNDSTYRNYFRAMFFGLFRGGVLTKELQADTQALTYVSKESLVAVHSLDLNSENPTVSMEKHNRILRLKSMQEPENKLRINIVVSEDI